MPILAGSGASRCDDAYDAGVSAASDALLALGSQEPTLVIAFTTDRYNADDLVRGIRSVTGAAPLIGCSAAQGICNSDLLRDGVAVLALGGSDLDVTVALATGLSKQVGQLGEWLEEQLDGNLLSFQDDTHMVALMLHDGLTGQLVIDTILQEVASLLGPMCPLVGGGAGDSMRFQRVTQFVNDQIANDALALALLCSKAPIGIGVRHGWTPDSRGLVVTRSEHNIVYELDGKRAIDAYREIFPTEDLPVDNFGLFGLTHPLGLAHLRDEYLMRVPLRTRPDGAIECGGNVPENSMVYTMQSTHDSLLSAAQAAARQAVDGLGGRPAAAALVFNCVTRPMILGDDTQTELDVIRSIIGAETPIVGMTSFGEIATDGGLTAVQGITVVVCVIGKE